MHIVIKKGLDVPLTGEPDQTIQDGPPVKRVAVIGADYVGLKPTMVVNVGDPVKLGQLLFTDKKNPGVKYTAPGAGKIIEINRGEKRVLLSVVIELEGTAEETFASYPEKDLKSVTAEQVKTNLIDSGLWSALRTRPFSKVPAIDSTPHSLFVTAMDTNPLCVNAAMVIKASASDFNNGLLMLSKLTEGKLYVCQAPHEFLPSEKLDYVTPVVFQGPHPAGLAGTHIHFLDPVSHGKTVWSVDYQDVIAIGRLFVSGKLNTERIISVAGPVVRLPKVVRTRLGASTDALTEGNLEDGENRIISGSVLSGRTASTTLAYLGRYHSQVSVLREGRERYFLAWLGLGFERFSIKNIYFSALNRSKKYALNTNVMGSPRAIVPFGCYEQVMPLDILPTHLVKALVMEDTDLAQDLGCLELDEEDLSLCTFVCPGKIEYGPILRRNLTKIEKEG
ncbi:Na(+)-translocating NADH-quinone reductase subunit A [Deltaproteobacteria bacterium TL4]